MPFDLSYQDFLGVCLHYRWIPTSLLTSSHGGHLFARSGCPPAAPGSTFYFAAVVMWCQPIHGQKRSGACSGFRCLYMIVSMAASNSRSFPAYRALLSSSARPPAAGTERHLPAISLSAESRRPSKTPSSPGGTSLLATLSVTPAKKGE